MMSKAEAGRLGGLRTVQRHGVAHMQAIGRRGFARAVELGYGEWLARERLRESYVNKYGHEPVLTASGQAGRPRAGSTLGACAWPGCDAPASDHHHVDGWRYSDDQIGLCEQHHIAFHRAYRAACRRVDPRWDGATPTPRTVAMSLGLLDLGGIPA